MDKKYLKKIIAQSPEDLQFISACCSEAKVKISDIKYLSKNQIFLVYIQRFVRETEEENRKINSIIKFEFIESSKSKNIGQKYYGYNEKGLINNTNILEKIILEKTVLNGLLK